jgi:hypothetical protein
VVGTDGPLPELPLGSSAGLGSPGGRGPGTQWGGSPGGRGYGGGHGGSPGGGRGRWGSPVGQQWRGSGSPGPFGYSSGGGAGWGNGSPAAKWQHR